MDKDILECFQKSTAVSLVHGQSSNLLKAGIKRRRTRQEILDEKEEVELRNQQSLQALTRIQELEQKLEQAQMNS